MINLTQHQASQDQLEVGVYNLQGEELLKLKELLTFEELPSKVDMMQRAAKIAQMAELDFVINGDPDEERKALIGGAPFFMRELEEALIVRKITPYYAFSKREVVEMEGVKTSIFKHLGFIEGGNW